MGNTIEIVIKGADEFSGTFNNLHNAMKGIGSLAAGAFTVGIGAAAAGIGILGAGLASSVQEAMAAQEAQAQLGAVLKSTGGIAGISADMANELAGSLQKVTRFSDEAILGGENLLLTFTNIGKDIFPGATKTMLDMSQALGQDLKASAIQLGKALQDPIDGVSALRRVGVNFSDDQKAVIENLVKTGRAAEAQKLILKELQTEFGGVAEAAGKTFAGRLDILRNQFSDLQEEVGMAVIPILSLLMDKVITPMTPLIESAANSVVTLLGSLEKIAAGDLSSLNNLIPSDMKNSLTGLSEAFKNLRAAFVEQLPQMKAQGEEFAAWLKTAFGETGTQLLNDLSASVNALAKIWREHGDEIMAVVSFIAKVAIATIGGALTILGGIVTAGLQLLSGDFSGAWNTILNSIKSFWNLSLSIVGMNLDEFLSMWSKNLDMLKIIVVKSIENVLVSIGTTTLDFIDAGFNLIDGMRQGIVNAASGLLDAVKKLMGDVMREAQNLLGIHSKSVKFEWLGEMSGEGFNAGLQKMMPNFDSLMGGLVPSMVTASPLAAGGMGGGTTIGSINLTVNGTSDPQETARLVIRELQDRDLIARRRV